MEKSLNNLLRKVSSPDMDGNEQQEILSLFHRDNLEFKVKAELTDILDSTCVTGEESRELRPFFEEIWRMISERKRMEKRRSLPLASMMKIAAALLVGLLIGRLIFTDHNETGPSFYTSMAPKGSISQMVLPDCTFICLNSGSTLKYASSGKNAKREVFLDGEAWFQVQKSAGRPFIVHTSIYDVNVKGTEFNIKAYFEDNDVVTTLEKGEVVITSDSAGFKKSVVLEQGEQLVYNKDAGSTAVNSVNTQWFTSWKENKLIFINMSLNELVVLLERKYGVDIQVLDPEILKFHYDGIIKNESIIDVLNLLELTLPVAYSINDQMIEISRKKSK